MKTDTVGIKIPYYTGNVYKSEVIGYMSLDEFVYRNKYSTRRQIDLFERIKKASKRNNLPLKRKLKQYLLGFTPSIIINKGCSRTYENVVEYNPLMQLDFDGIKDKDVAYDLKIHLFENNPEVVCAYLSPSGFGVKALIRIKKPENKDHFKAIHKAVTTKFEMYGYFDTVTKNATLLLFESYDINLLYRKFEDCVEFDQEDWSVTDYVHLNDESPKPFINNRERDYYYNKVVRIATNRINSITDNGHPQLRSACLIIGSRAAAGYIDIFEAKELMLNLVRANAYLQKGIKGYERTVEWAVNEGYKTPKYF